MTREETAQLVAMMKAAWPNHPTPEPEAIVMAYWLGLDDVPTEAAMAAFRAHLRDAQRGRFFPTVAELRAARPLSAAPALPPGNPIDRPLMRYRRFDGDLDDYVELEEPEPWTREHLAESRREMHRAWVAEQGRFSPT